MKINTVLKIILLIFVSIMIGTIIDYFVHRSNVRFSVPSSYFPHKIFYGTIWAVVSLFIARKFTKKWLELAIISSFVPAVALQTIYFIKMHLALDVVLLFLVLHFFMFLAPMLILFKKYRNLFA
jgi:hypothetical protein